MRRTTFGCGIAGVVAFAAVLAFAPAATRAGEPAAGSASLEAALASIQAEKIRADIDYIACDDMGGRDTPSSGQRLTARFLRNRLQRLGLQPGAEGGWFHTYPLNFKRVKEPETRAWLEKDGTREELVLGRDYYLSSRDLAAVDLTGGLLFCGSGTKEEVGQTLALRGKVALVIDRGDAGRRGDSGRSAAEVVAAVGAVAMVLMRADDARGPAYEESFPPRLEALRNGAASWPSASEEPRLPRVYLPKATAKRLLALADVTTPRVGQELGVTFGEVVALQGDGTIQAENVCAWWPGESDTLAKEAIVVSAHYDHLGVDGAGQVFNGADDNGSGTTGLLALAEALVEYGPLDRSVVLIWVSGEEKGLWGSQAWSSAPWLPDGAKAVADINIDMIGRNAPDSLLITPTAKHPAYNGLVTVAERFAPQEGFTKLGSADDYYTRSDHAMFARLGIPVTFLFADIHKDYHKVTDDPDKIDCDKIARVVRVVLRMIAELQGPTLLPPK